MPTHNSPDLIKLCLKCCAIGFVLATVFLGLLVGLNVMGLATYLAQSNVGPFAVLLVWVFNGIVFGGIQFAIVMLGLADDDDDDHHGGHRASVYLAEPVPIRVDRRPRRK